MSPRRLHLIGASLMLAYTAVLAVTEANLGMSRDEAIYVRAAESYAGWFQQLLEAPGEALRQDSIDRHWTLNHEHPALAKSLFAVSLMLHRSHDLFARESLAHRFPGMLCAGALLWLILVYGNRLFGFRAGLFAALAYAALPRPFYHAHLNAFDVPITLAITALFYAYHRSLRERRWAWITGGLFGLALATKHNSWIVPGIFAIHFTLVALLELRRRRAGVPARISLIPHWLLAMLVLGPPIFVASWPWLWHDTLPRFGRYAGFHLDHDYYNMAYLGVNHFWPPFPVSFPWVMTLYTVPLTLLALALAGVVLLSRRYLGQTRASLAGGGDLEPELSHILMLGGLLAPMLIIALPWTPIFGGTKHWFPSYPFLALYGGLGFHTALGVYVQRWRDAAPALRHGLSLTVGALLLAPGVVETAHSHPFGLSHYGVAAGGVPGAADRGMNRQFWGFTTASLGGFFREALPKGGSIWICDTLPTALHMLIKDGALPRGIRAARDISRADYAIVHHEHHFAEVDHQIWTTYGQVRPVTVLTYDGVPIISVYENPRRRGQGR